MAGLGPPAVDFYSMLSGLGDTLQNNAKLQQQRQLDAARQQGFSSFSALDPSSPDYGKSVMTLAGQMGAAGAHDDAFKMVGVAHQAISNARQKERDATSDQHWSITDKRAANADRRAAAAEGRAAADYENTPDQYVPNPRANEPGQPKLIDQYAQAKSAAEADAPGGGGLSLNPVYGKDKDGNTVLLQMGKNGVAAQSRMPEGVTLNGMDNETIASDAKRLNAGDTEIMKKYSKNGQGRVDLLRLNNEANRQRAEKGQDPIDLTQATITMAGDKARERAAGTMEGRMAPAAIEAQGAFKIAQNSLDNLWRTNSVPLNKLLQMGEAAMSDPDLKASAVAVNTAAMTYSRAIAPTGVGTVDSQQHAREILSTADGPKATAAAFAQLAREVDMAHASPGIAREYFAASRKARAEGKPMPAMPEYQPAQPAKTEPPPEAIAALKKDPRRAADFDAYYGAGSARAALSGNR